MNRREFIASTCAGAVGLAASRANGQARPARPDLAALAEGNRLRFVNRSASLLVDGQRRGVRASAGQGEGAAFLPEVDLSTGTIEVDLRGRDVPQQSFLGIAFHRLNDTTFDAIYFRPFNFRATDPVSRGHAVQYISEPAYPWQKLRADHPGKYEAGIRPVPDPNGWFRARIVVRRSDVSVFVADAAEPCLKVDLLADRSGGSVGLWVGNNSGGDFANLTIG